MPEPVSVLTQRWGRPDAHTLAAWWLRRNGRYLTPTGVGDIGFAVAPRINAAGRLEDMALGIECLLGDDIDTCRMQAEALDALPEHRRD